MKINVSVIAVRIEITRTKCSNLEKFRFRFIDWVNSYDMCKQFLHINLIISAAGTNRAISITEWNDLRKCNQSGFSDRQRHYNNVCNHVLFDHPACEQKKCSCSEHQQKEMLLSLSSKLPTFHARCLQQSEAERSITCVVPVSWYKTSFLIS